MRKIKSFGLFEALRVSDKAKFTDEQIKEAEGVLEEVRDILLLDLESFGFTWSIDLDCVGNSLFIKAVISSSAESFRTSREEFFDCMARIDTFSRGCGWKYDVIGGGIHGSGTRFTYSIMLRPV